MSGKSVMKRLQMSKPTPLDWVGFVSLSAWGGGDGDGGIAIEGHVPVCAGDQDVKTILRVGLRGIGHGEGPIVWLRWD